MPTPSTDRIYINGRFLGQRVTGVQRYARETLLALDALLPHDPRAVGLDWTLLVPRGTPAAPLRHIRVAECGRWQGHAWEQLDLPWHSRDGVLANFGLTGPMLKQRQFVTVHDASVVRMPQSFKPAFRWWYAQVVRRVAQRAPRTMAVSEFSAHEAVACFGVSPDRLRVGTEGWQHLERVVADDAILDRHGLRERPFALAVSSPTPNKNFAAIARALAAMGSTAPRCVVVGASDGAVFQADTAASDAMVRVGYVSDGELKALYQSARCFVFPSFYEGFGIPPLEAMASGCPVVASTAEAVREVCGGAALYFDPSDSDALARQLKKVFASEDLRAVMREEGLRRAARYSWRRAAEITLDVVCALLSEARVPAQAAPPALAADD